MSECRPVQYKKRRFVDLSLTLISSRHTRSLFRQIFYLPLFILILFESSLAQEPQQGPVQQNVVNPIDIFDVIKRALGKKDTTFSEIPQIGINNVSLLPILGYSPANGFVIGAAVGITKLLGDPTNTTLSSALANISLTTKQQVLINLRTDIYTPGNKWLITGDNRLLFFSQPTYGLGIYGLNNTYSFAIGDNSVERTIQEQPMRFNYIRLYDAAVRKTYRNWYAGLGINFDFHYQIKDEALKLDTPNPYISSNYFYSKKYGFDTSHYATNGLTIHFIQDSRDNSVNPYKGYYADLGFRFNPTWLGSSQSSTMLYAEFRDYFNVQKSRPRHLIAVWFWGTFVTGGNVPYLALPAITWDTYGRSGRGYIQGRFRGTSMVYGEVEYRFPISRDGLFGGVLFANSTTASNPITGQDLFFSIAPAGGFGLRIKMNKKDRTNICVDYGIGRSFTGIYFNIRETF
jgi:outer membrane protein assembly factor BamA